MNRRQKIIVSVVGIFIVLLALVGLTYAYFLTQIKGNTNKKSISVTTANLRLVYGGDDGSIIGDNEIIEPDTTFAPKTFTVSNEGNEKIDSYAVVIENFGVYYNEDSTIIENNVEVPVYANDVTKLSRPQDFEIVITCKNQDEEDCTGYSGALPTESAIMLTNSIEVDEVQTYTATLTYKEAGTNQSADMNKRIEGKFNIIGLSDTVDLKGTVTSYQKGDYVQTNSTKRVSAINPDGSYKVLGLEAGTHKIKVCAADPEHPEVKDCADEEAKLIQEINIVQGETASGNNTTKTITITEDSREATVNVNVTNSSVTIEEEVNDYVNPNVPYAANTLAYKLVDKAYKSDALTPYVEYSKLGVTANTSLPITGVVTNNEHVMSSISDKYSTSYFYRGAVSDNWVLFNNACWRIVRITGNGNVKLIYSGDVNSTTSCSELAAQDKKTSSFLKDSSGNNLSVIYGCSDDRIIDNELEIAYYLLDYNNKLVETDPNYSKGLKATLEEWFDNNFKEENVLTEAGKKVNNETWCLGEKTGDVYEIGDEYGYLSYKRAKENRIDLTCQNEDTIDLQIGAITSDEAYLAGTTFTSNEESNTHYLMENAYNNGESYWTLSKWLAAKKGFNSCDNAGQIGYFENSGNTGNWTGTMVSYSGVNCESNQAGVRPMISLKANVDSTNATGTIDNPYIID